jgi:hypothetical protein
MTDYKLVGGPFAGTTMTMRLVHPRTADGWAVWTVTGHAGETLGEYVMHIGTDSIVWHGDNIPYTLVGGYRMAVTPPGTVRATLNWPDDIGEPHGH